MNTSGRNPDKRLAQKGRSWMAKATERPMAAIVAPSMAGDDVGSASIIMRALQMKESPARLLNLASKV
jgi:hypothetical protein